MNLSDVITPAVTPAALTAFVVAAAGLLKQIIPEGPRKTAFTRILVIAVALAAVFADRYLPPATLDTLVAGFSLGAAALGAYGVGKPAVTSAASAVRSVRVSRKSKVAPTAPEATPAA
jgi:hypothetical protein